MPISKAVDNGEDSPPIRDVCGFVAWARAGAEAVAEVSAGLHRRGQVGAKRPKT
jgi:hypothetical protein